MTEHIKNAHESGTYKCDECDNVDNGMCKIKEHMIMEAIGDNECN